MANYTRPLFPFSGSKTWAHRHICTELHRAIVECNPTVYCDTEVRGLHSFIYMTSLLKRHSIRNVILNDPVPEIIDIYRSIIHHRKAFLCEMRKLMKAFWDDVLWEQGDGSTFYYELRNRYNQGTYNATSRYVRAAQLAMLQMCGYQGIYRVTSKGHYTSPYDAPHLRKFVADFDGSFEKFDEESVVARIEMIHNLLSGFRVRFRNHKDISKLKTSGAFKGSKTLYRIAPRTTVANQGGVQYLLNPDQAQIMADFADENYVYQDFWSEDFMRLACERADTHTVIVNSARVASSTRNKNLPELIVVNLPKSKAQSATLC